MAIVTELDLLKYRRTKIVATVGPASASRESLASLVEAGVNVFRINLSHGSQAGHAAAITLIREVSSSLQTHTAVLADLCGPKIRTGRFEGGQAELKAGASVTLTVRDVLGHPGLIPSQYAALPQDVSPGQRILLNDGAIELSVEAVTAEEVKCRIVNGGVVSDHKGINLPDSQVSAPALTAKDRLDAEFALAAGVDFLALSFVRKGADVMALREIVDRSGSRADIIAKIETPEALENSADILHAADGIMVARGDLGVELNPEQVPLAQAQLIHLARSLNKPVVVATQMLESMIVSPRPTRAEVSDVAFAVASGADAVMLSGESAVGAYPVAAVRMMDRVARQTESYHWYSGLDLVPGSAAATLSEVPFGDAIADATAKLVGDLKARAVIVLSLQGMSAITLSAARPSAPLVGISNDSGTCRRMSLMWGVIPYCTEAAGRENPNEVARAVAEELELAVPGEFIVLVRGFSADPALNSPSITLLRL